jgi:AAA+ superfamily predicted ATPase
MREIGKKEEHKIGKKTDKDREIYAEIERTVEIGKPKEIYKNIDSEVLASIVYRKLVKGSYLQPSHGKKKDKEGSRGWLWALGILVLLLALGKFQFGLLGDGQKGEYQFQDGSSFVNEKYYGKKSYLKKIICEITKVVELIDTLSPEELAEKFECTQKNYIFHGDPGTGKTLFMKRLAFKLDRNLKIGELIRQVGENNYIEMSLTERKKRLDAMDSMVRIVFITPSSLNSKWVGETEKNIRNLFNEANTNKKYKASIIFIDEIDAFFSDRKSERTTEHAQKSKTEFLNLIGGACDAAGKRVFLFGATNLFSEIDPAFLRRFPNRYHFLPPDPIERREIFQEILNFSWITDEECLDRLVGASNGLTQSILVGFLLKIKFDLENSVAEYTCRDLLHALDELKSNNAGADTDRNVVIPHSLLKYYHLSD